LADRKPASLNRGQLRFKNGSNLPHWPDKFCADKPRIITHYDTDHNHTTRYTALLLKVGGPEAAGAMAIA
jgi:hypothetical protein